MVKYNNVTVSWTEVQHIGWIVDNSSGLGCKMAISTLSWCTAWETHYIWPPVPWGGLHHNYKGTFAANDGCHWWKKRFIYVSIRTQGRISDSQVFAHSDQGKAMDEGLLILPPPEPLPDPLRQMVHHQRVLKQSVKGMEGERKCIWHSCKQVQDFRLRLLLHPSIHHFLRDMRFQPSQTWIMWI